MFEAIESERDALHEIAELWRDFNWRFLKKSLKEPTFSFFDSERLFGRWSREHRLIEVSRSLITQHPWAAVEEVLKHEMAHQYVDEVLKRYDETAHGEAFRRTCMLMGIDSTASGPLPNFDLSETEAAARAKIVRLLSLATSPNQHEAEAAMLAARRLMLKHNIDAEPGSKRYAFKRLGKPARRVSEAMRVLSRILSEHFFVEVLWVGSFDVASQSRGRVLEIVGTPANLAIAEYVHAYLLHATTELWEKHRKTHETNRDRRVFQTGAMYGFLEKLGEEKQTTKEYGLIWVGDPDLEAFFSRRHPRRSTMKSGGHRRTAAFHHGRKAGRQIVLKKALAETETSGRNLALGSGKSSR